MKFLIDMNLSPLWVSFLAGHGLEAVHWSNVGQPEAPDSEIFEFAAAGGWIIFTHDLDFGLMLAVLRTRRPSVIQVRAQDVLPSAIGELVLRAIRATESHLEAGASSPWTHSAIAFGSCRSKTRKTPKLELSGPSAVSSRLFVPNHEPAPFSVNVDHFD
jgi:predicted nuclease of predicted toxin-antitoxin system